MGALPSDPKLSKASQATEGGGMKWFLSGDSLRCLCPRLPTPSGGGACGPRTASGHRHTCVAGGAALSEVVLATALGLFLNDIFGVGTHGGCAIGAWSVHTERPSRSDLEKDFLGVCLLEKEL